MSEVTSQGVDAIVNEQPRGYTDVATDYPPMVENSSFPDMPPPSYSSNNNYSPIFNSGAVRNNIN